MTTFTPQEYIDQGFPYARTADSMTITQYMKPHEAAAAVAFMTGSNGTCLDGFAKSNDSGHIWAGAIREARKGRTPKSAPCEGKTVEIDGVTYELRKKGA